MNEENEEPTTLEKLEQFTCHQLFKHLGRIIELERRLAEVEKTKVQFVGSPTQGIRPKIFNSGCSSCGKVLLDGKCLDCECSCRSYNNAGVSLCELHKKIHISKN